MAEKHASENSGNGNRKGELRIRLHDIVRMKEDTMEEIGRLDAARGVAKAAGNQDKEDELLRGIAALRETFGALEAEEEEIKSLLVNI